MNKLTNNSEKLNFIIKHLNLKGDLIAKDFGLGASYISKMRNHYDNTLKDVHLYAFENCYGIPMRIFKDDTISTEAEIIAILDEHKECNDNIPPQKSRQFKNKSNFLQNSQPHATISTKFL